MHFKKACQTHLGLSLPATSFVDRILELWSNLIFIARIDLNNINQRKIREIRKDFDWEDLFLIIENLPGTVVNDTKERMFSS